MHALQHILFVSFGIAIWMALLGPLPKPAWFGNGAKIGYIIAVRLIQSVLANALLWSSGVLYPRYAAGQAEWGISAANDQSAAGAIMMIEGSIVTIGLFCWLFLRAARESDERQALVELAAARGVELSEERAARAVAAGRGEALRGASSRAEMSPTRGSASFSRSRGSSRIACRWSPPAHTIAARIEQPDVDHLGQLRTRPAASHRPRTPGTPPPISASVASRRWLGAAEQPARLVEVEPVVGREAPRRASRRGRAARRLGRVALVGVGRPRPRRPRV